MRKVCKYLKQLSADLVNEFLLSLSKCYKLQLKIEPSYHYFKLK